MEVIRQRGFTVTELPAGPDDFEPQTNEVVPLPVHSHWLGCDFQTDAEQTLVALRAMEPDWLVVDHYAIDIRWEERLRPYCSKLMVIDDLADRSHSCDLLLDQNLGRELADYVPMVPAHCTVLTGPSYALLRPEFAALRSYSLSRRAHPQFKRFLITMGGVDRPNATGQVLDALRNCPLPLDCRMTVVMGPHAPWLASVCEGAVSMPWPTEVKVGVANMAQLMADSDLAIGAAGSTSWERCCLGLPTLLVVLADNQWPGAKALQEAQVASLIGDVSDIATQLPLAIQALTQDHRLMHMSTAASVVTDGRGVDKVLQTLGVMYD
jgi:UDP-2,4-diacetamido-2,4,6-trideoxy-beta-L-altropyranose hydrolase